MLRGRSRGNLLSPRGVGRHGGGTGFNSRWRNDSRVKGGDVFQRPEASDGKADIQIDPTAHWQDLPHIRCQEYRRFSGLHYLIYLGKLRVI